MTQCRLHFDIGGKFAPLIGLRDREMGINTMITTYNTAVIDAASEILGEEASQEKDMGHLRCSRTL